MEQASVVDMVSVSLVGLLLIALLLFTHGCAQDELYGHVAEPLVPPYSTITDVSGVDIGVEELRSVGRSVTRRTLSKWHGDNDLTRQEETVLELLKDNPWTQLSVREGGRNTVNFSPRLGREEEVVFTETSRSPPFAPRLGRIVFTPRFGRLTLAGQH